MKFLISLVLLSFSFLALTTQPLAAVGDVNYISDVLNVPLRSGPSTAHRIIHRGLPSGTQLTVLATDEEAGFTQIRTAGGMEGWVRSQHLIGQPIARVKLAAAEKRLKDLKGKIDKEREARASIQAKHKETEATNRTLNSKVESPGQRTRRTENSIGRSDQGACPQRRVDPAERTIGWRSRRAVL